MLWTKTKGQPQFKNRGKKAIITKAALGLILLMIPIIIIIVDPLKQIIFYGTQIKNGSFLFNIFQTEVEGARLQLYIFNVTNTERFLAGDDYKLKVEEVGPFTYLEIRRNGDVELDEDNGYIWFTPYMKVKFVPELSIGDPHKIQVNVPNLALMSATSLLSKYPSWFQSGFNIFASQMGSKIISKVDAHSFLWGYKDPLIGLANKIIPGLIYFDKLGIIDRLYDEKSFYRIQMSTKEEDKFSIKTLNKYLKGKKIEYQYPLERTIHLAPSSPKLNNNMLVVARQRYKFNNTYEGASYPPGLTKSTPLNIYRIGVCRPFTLEFEREITMDYGPRAWVYKINNETFNRDCGIKDGICGVLDLSKCTFGIPIVISRTHFLNTDPKVYARIDGMKPNETKHDSVFVLEQKMGFELVTNLSLQLNMALGDVSFNSQTARFSNMTVPISYIEVFQPEVFDDFKTILKVVYIYGPNILLCIELILFIIAISVLLKAFKIYCNSRSVDVETNIVTISDKKVPLLSK